MIAISCISHYLVLKNNQSQLFYQSYIQLKEQSVDDGHALSLHMIIYFFPSNQPLNIFECFVSHPKCKIESFALCMKNRYFAIRKCRISRDSELKRLPRNIEKAFIYAPSKVQNGFCTSPENFAYTEKMYLTKQKVNWQTRGQH